MWSVRNESRICGKSFTRQMKITVFATVKTTAKMTRATTSTTTRGLSKQQQQRGQWELVEMMVLMIDLGLGLYRPTDQRINEPTKGQALL